MCHQFEVTVVHMYRIQIQTDSSIWWRGPAPCLMGTKARHGHLQHLMPLSASWSQGAGDMMDAYKAPRELVRASGVADPTRDLRVAAYDWFQPSVVFYAQREVEKLPSPEMAAAFLAVPTPGYLFVTEETWNAWLKDKVSVPHREVARHFDFYRNCQVLVITNQMGIEGVASRQP